ncbi:hypothetical protein [Hyphobacterium sp.]|jgi:uncharacterized membrane protein|uniref:hypothetical protein n=1 Tax=Hyphobacterium sp. TaxID=2004662 RepID=UPI003BA9CFCB
MLRYLAMLSIGCFVLAGCASTPSSLSSDDMVSTMAPASPPPPESTEGGETYVGGGTGRGSVQPETRQITIELEDPAGAPMPSDGATGSAAGGGAAVGFVYPAIGSAFAGTRPEVPYQMQAAGEQPYWRSNAEFYEIEGTVFAQFSIIAVDETPLQATLREAPDHLANGFRRYVSRDPDGPRISAAYQAGPCLDGMGVERGFFTSIRVDDTTYEGCARETGGQWDWSRDLLTRYDAILICLDEVPAAVAAVDAYSPTPENTAVRVMSADQQRHECVIVNEDQRLASVRALDITEVHLNEGRTVFSRAPLVDADGCLSQEVILNTEGETLGYLAHDLCQNPRRHVEGPLDPGES